MHTKVELEEMTSEELATVASGLGIDASKSPDTLTLIYQIIDEESIQGSKEATETQKKRKSKTTKKVKEDSIANANKETGNVAEEKPAPKKRGRKSKAELEAMKALQEKLEQQAQEQKATSEQQSQQQPQPQPTPTTPTPKKRGRKSKAEKEAMLAAAANKNAEQQILPLAVDNETSNVTTESTQNEKNDSADEEVEAFFNADEPSFIIIKDIPLTESGIASESTYTEIHTANETSTSQTEIHEYDFDDSLVTQGVLEVSPDGYGYLRSSDYNYLPAPDDIYITGQQIRQYGLKMGDVVEGPVAIPREGERFYTLMRVDKINGRLPKDVRDRIAFEHLTPLFPDEKFTLCDGRGDSTSSRVVDLFSPIGKGQRALLVAQPKTGKTMLMKDIANSIAKNHPEAYLMVLLIDERPEEVTDMARTVNAEVIASTFDEPAEHHVHVANLVLEKAKRLVECGHDVVIFLDSITRLARAYNTVAPASGKILSGGVDANSLQKPKRFFGAARNIEGGGSLTIIATALIDTGSKMDEVIFEEFKGTGNMELQLDRQLSNKRIFPAVNIIASSTRRDDLLQDRLTLDRMWILRKLVADMTPVEAMTFVKDRLEGTKDNVEFLMSMGGK